MASSTSSPDPLPHRSRSDPLPSLGDKHKTKVVKAAKKATEEGSLTVSRLLLKDNPLAGRVKPGTIPPLSRLNPELQAWLDDPTVTGNKQKAIQHIEHAIAHPKEKKLLLKGLELNKAPPLACLANQLKYVDLSENKLTTFPSEALIDCTKLTTLILSHNKINNLSQLTSTFDRLQILNLSHNQLSELPDMINCLCSLQELDISYNSLSRLPDSILNLTYLTALNISGNKPELSVRGT